MEEVFEVFPGPCRLSRSFACPPSARALSRAFLEAARIAPSGRPRPELWTRNQPGTGGGRPRSLFFFRSRQNHLHGILPPPPLPPPLRAVPGRRGRASGLRLA